mgnify:CR=1 FL=1
MRYRRTQRQASDGCRIYQKKKEAEKMEQELLQKTEKSTVQIGNVTVNRGEKYQGEISFEDGEIVLPGTIICGKLPGKTMLNNSKSIINTIISFFG